MPFLRNRK